MQSRRGPVLSLRHLLTLLAAIGLLPLAALGIWSIHEAREYRLHEQARAELDLARALSSAVDAELDATVGALAGLSRTPQMRAGELRGVYALARELAQNQPDWVGVVLTDADGAPLFRTMAPFGAAPVPIADPASLRAALDLRRPVIGRIARGPRGRPAVPVRIAFTDAAGRLYTLTAVVQPTRVLRVIERQQVPPGSVISVLDSGNAIVARSTRQDDAVARQPHASLLRLLQSGPESSGDAATFEGRPVVVAYTRLSRYGWTVAVGAPPAGGGIGLTLYGAGLAASLALGVLLASWLARRIARRIEVLAMDAAALGAGASVAASPSRIREIDRMAHALDVAARRRQRHEEERSQLLASLEDALRSQQAALEQARQAGLAKDEFLAVLGHELRNPLSPIVSSLDLMDMRDEPSGRRERAIMRRQVTHLKRLVDDLLDVSRIASGKLQVDLQPLNLADTVRHAAAAATDAAVSVTAPPAVWIRGDDSRLTQVLGNLLSNAARFGSSATRIELDTVDGQARLSVSDNGAGIEAEHLPRIFDPFFQAPQTLARRTGGLGLGLAIVRKIVELHSGRISAGSDGAGKGSRFEILLPLAATAAPPAAARQPAHESAQRRVLVVDDNEDAAATIAALLERIGHVTRVAHDAAQGLALADAFKPEVAVLDIGLPDMDGFALARAMRVRAGARELRLVALSGYGQQADVERALAAGFDVHLSKPASLDDLRRAVGAPAGATAA